MNIFLDTSALMKLYHQEALSAELRAFLTTEAQVSSLVISRLGVVEYTSAVWQKQRIASAQAIGAIDTSSLLMDLENDILLGKYTIAGVRDVHFVQTAGILNKCNSFGNHLRTLDALQLSVAYQLASAIDLVLTCDKGMNQAAMFLGLSTKLITAAGAKGPA